MDIIMLIVLGISFTFLVMLVKWSKNEIEK